MDGMPMFMNKTTYASQIPLAESRLCISRSIEGSTKYRPSLPLLHLHPATPEHPAPSPPRLVSVSCISTAL
ncbi:hypothetical protein GJ744_000363 [Endocarpon pusillum]|uniref:Uncharacterized protein n=1 Tax=Endocarpon pusillum TaxID=364733 RepID=A0A8H7ATM6_9EURO|nr:hypothetical protein GJ744_000363 [Endocarpon pusillum]